MHPQLDLIYTLAGGLVGGLVLGLLTRKMGLSPIVGYLLGGIVIGPFTPGFVANEGLASEMAELGVILLMFGVGLQFHIKELLAVRKIALPGALIQVASATAAGMLAAHYFGWTTSAGLIFGLSLSVASTVVLVRVLSDNKLLHTGAGHLAVGWLVIEDIITVLALVVIPQVVGGSESVTAGGVALSLGVALLKVGLLFALAMVLGRTLLPRMFAYIASTGSRELFTLGVLSTALVLAVGASLWFGASMALGAFIAGIIIGRSEFSTRAASEALPFRDAFAVLFFVSVGMLLNPYKLFSEWLEIAITMGIIMIVKPVVALVVVLAMKKPVSKALPVALSLAQIGEFSFILGTLGIQLKVLPADSLNIMVASSILSITLAPLLINISPTLERWLLKIPVVRKISERAAITVDPQHGVDATDENRTIVVGYGPIGKTLVKLLNTNNVNTLVLELNLETVRHLLLHNQPAVYGDATNNDTLKVIGAESASILIVTSSHLPNRLDLVKAARGLNPTLRIIVRADYAREQAALYQAGADLVFTAEQEIALSMGEFVLRSLGATPEYVDSVREQITKSFQPEMKERLNLNLLKKE